MVSDQRSSELLRPQAGIEDGVEDVDRHADDDEDGGDDQRNTLHDRIVAIRDRLVDVATDPGQTEDRLDDHRAPEQAGYLNTGHGENRQGGIENDVAAKNAPFRQPFGAGHAHMLLA